MSQNYPRGKGKSLMQQLLAAMLVNESKDSSTQITEVIVDDDYHPIPDWKQDSIPVNETCSCSRTSSGGYGIITGCNIHVDASNGTGERRKVRSRRDMLLRANRIQFSGSAALDKDSGSSEPS